MSNALKCVKCRVWGHDINCEALYYYNVAYCERCGGEIYEDTGLREWLRVRWWRCKEAVRETWGRLIWRLRRCPDCGLRFGRHNDSVDHIPF